MSIRRLAIGLSLVVLGGALIGVAFRSELSSQGNPQTATVIAGRNVNMVSGTTLPGGDPWLQRQNEPSIAVSSRNPLHLLAGCNDYRTVDMPISEGELPGKGPVNMVGDAWLGVFTSYDGGESWTSTMLPGYPQDPSANPLKVYRTAADPVVRCGPNGLFYYSGIAFNRDTNLGVVFVARFIDNNNKEGGGSIQYIDTKIVAVGSATRFLDKPWIAVDQPRLPAGNIAVAGQSIPRHNVYIAYSAFSGSGTSTVGDVMFARSTDCGTTWGAPVKVSSGNYAHQGATIAVKPVLGEVLVAWRRFAQAPRTPDSIFVAQSFTRGLTFLAPVKVADVAPFDQPTTDPLHSLPGTGPGPAFRTNSYPAMATDANGHVYLAWSQRGVGPNGDARIMVSSSYLGSSWSSPAAVTGATPSGSSLGHQIMPALGFAGGKLILVWYDQRNDVSGAAYGYNNWILDDQPYRHTMDVWAAIAETKNFPALAWKSNQVSRYLYAALNDGSGGLVTDDNGNPVLFPAQFNCVNYTMFKGGLNAFMGDYIDVAASPTFRIDSWRNWYLNATSPDSPVFHVAWTDNRDVRPPLDGNWASYAPAASTQSSEFVSPDRNQYPCLGGNGPGMRNQNIYTARVTYGLEAGSPTNSKPLNLTGASRAFVIYVKNHTGSLRYFRLTIASQPVGGRASFDQFDALPSLDVAIAAYSTIARTVFISSTDPTAPVTVTIDEINASGSVIAGGLKSSILLNGDPTNPQVPSGDETHDPSIENPANPNIINWYVNPNIINPNIINPNIINPNIINPNIINPNIINVSNPNIINPNIINPNIINPNIINVSNPNIINPNIINPNIINPNIINSNPADNSITDVTWTVRNDGTATTAYTLKALSKKAPPEGVYVQLLVYRVHYTPAVAGAELSSTGINGCELKQEPHHELVLSVVNPNIINPNIINPNIINPNIINSSIENATFSVAPGEEVVVDLRVLDTAAGQAQSQGVMKAMSAGASTQAFSVQDFIESLGFAVTSQAVNTEDARAGVEVPPAAATELVIGTASLPDGIVGLGYQAMLTAYGGTGSYSWSLNSGELPPGLLISSSGLISGTPITAGTFSFIVRVDDGNHFDTQQYSIFIDNDAVANPLAVLTASLPDGVQGFWYGATLEAAGGVWPRTWSLAGGALPAGLSLDPGGAISGTPTVSGTFGFTLKVTDGAGQYATRTFSLVIGAFTGNIAISGTVRDGAGFPLDGVLLRGLPNTPMTADDGTYSAPVPKGWAGTVTPFKVGYFFSPESRTYASEQTQANVVAQDYASSNWLVREEWAARYNGPAENSNDSPAAMAADSQGNVYLAGTGQNGRERYDYMTVKYSASGAQPLVAFYSGPRYIDFGTAIAIDRSDNIFVTGWSYGPSYPATPLDVVTVKYDGSLNQLWAVRYDSSDSDVEPTAMGTDAAGNVYVTGRNSPSATPSVMDLIVLKYSGSGALQAGWPQTYHVEGYQLNPKGVAVDSAGNVYVTGALSSADPLADDENILTVMYNSAGVLQWVRTVDGSAHWYDYPIGIAVHPSGVYVVGCLSSTDTYADYLLIKYDSSGSEVWRRTYSRTPSTNDTPLAMAVRSNGDIYITGRSSGGGNYTSTVGYNSAGDLVWETADLSIIRPVALAVDPGGSVSITGSLADPYFSKIRTVKYGPDRTLLWTLDDDAGRRGSDRAIGVALTPAGDVMVCGNSQGGSTNTDFYSALYHSTDSGPQVQWRQFASGPSNDDNFLAMALDPQGNVYATGGSFGLGTFMDFTTVKYDGSGQPAWPSAARYDKSGYQDTAVAMVTSGSSIFVTGPSYLDTGTGWSNEIATVKYSGADGSQLAEARYGGVSYVLSGAMAADPSGNVYVVGYVSGADGSQDFLTIKYDASLVQQWVRLWNSPEGNDEEAMAVTVDAAGSVYVTGRRYDLNWTTSDIVTVKYDPSGNLIWEAVYDGPDHLYDDPLAIKTDAVGNVLVLGTSEGTTTGTDFVTIKYGPSGNQLWAVRYNGPMNSFDTPYGLAVDASGNVYVVGGSIGTSTYEDYVTVKYGPNGNLIWAVRYDSNYSLHDAAQAVAVDPSGNVYVTGRSQGKSGHSDFATLKYDASGQLVWVIRYNGPGDTSNYGTAIAIDAEGNVYVGGNSGGAGSNGMDYAIVKYKQR